VLADFGIARLYEPGAETVTEAGLSIGTPEYMSPEQASGERTIDTQSDVYRLDVVLYEMLAGEPPIRGGSARDHGKAGNRDPSSRSRAAA